MRRHKLAATALLCICGISLQMSCFNYLRRGEVHAYGQTSTKPKYTRSESLPLRTTNITTTNITNQSNPSILSPPTSKMGNTSLVILSLAKSRSDRMGSRIQWPLQVWAFARYHGWSFCAPPNEPMAEALSFPICNESTSMNLSTVPFQTTNITESGMYLLRETQHNVQQMIKELELQSSGSVWSNSTKHEWRRMIQGKRTQSASSLWKNQASHKIAVHLRRGDITPGKRFDVWIPDNHFISLIKVARQYIKVIQGQTAPIEVHIFSEDYGATNWTAFDGLVDAFHLAPEGAIDIDLNIRDWNHFINADVLIAGGTFSAVPALARDQLTIVRAKNMDGNWQRFVRWQTIGTGNMLVVNFPNATILAPTNLQASRNEVLESPAQYEPEVLGSLLCANCQLAAAGRNTCPIRIARRLGRLNFSRSALSTVQNYISRKVPMCTVCHSSVCSITPSYVLREI